MFFSFKTHFSGFFANWEYFRFSFYSIRESSFVNGYESFDISTPFFFFLSFFSLYTRVRIYTDYTTYTYNDNALFTFSEKLFLKRIPIYEHFIRIQCSSPRPSLYFRYRGVKIFLKLVQCPLSSWDRIHWRWRIAWNLTWNEKNYCWAISAVFSFTSRKIIGVAGWIFEQKFGSKYIYNYWNENTLRTGRLLWWFFCTVLKSKSLQNFIETKKFWVHTFEIEPILLWIFLAQ